MITLSAFNEKELASIAKRYENTKSNQDDIEVRKAYTHFIVECLDQFERIPIQIEFVKDDPYKTSKEMFSDCKQGKLRVFTGGNPHPLLSERENSIFRAVHDYYGHFLNSASFSVRGEYIAWENHRKMFSEDARGALDTETIGQASVYFFGSKPKQYAEQKAILL